jgi:hypothetical protein
MIMGILGQLRPVDRQGDQHAWFRFQRRRTRRRLLAQHDQRYVTNWLGQPDGGFVSNDQNALDHGLPAPSKASAISTATGGPIR